MTRSTCTWIVAALAAMLFGGAPASAQSGGLAERIAAAPSGTVTFAFEPRAEVCGHSSGSIVWGDVRFGRVWTDRKDEPCRTGPLRVAVALEDRRVQRLAWRVGYAPPTEGRVTDLGTVDGAAAATWLLALAEQAPERIAEEAVEAAALARADVWRGLGTVARGGRAEGARKEALLWLALLAGERITGAAPDRSDPELEVRKHAVFAIAQRPAAEATLLQLASDRERDPALRSAAFFWLADTGDPRAIPLLEDVLRTGR